MHVSSAISPNLLSVNEKQIRIFRYDKTKLFNGQILINVNEEGQRYAKRRSFLIVL